MKKLLFITLIALGCNPKGPYKPQKWWDEDTIYISDSSVIERLDTATTIDEIFPSELYEDSEYYDSIQ